MTDFSIE